MKRVQKGFTLIELMIVIAIIGVLASIAMPAYQTYTKRAKFSEVVLATTSYKTPIEIAYATDRNDGLSKKTDTDRFNGLTSGSHGIPAAKTTGTGVNATTGKFVASVGATNGTIKAVGTAGVDNAWIEFTPSDVGGAIRWTQSTGGDANNCMKLGLC